MPLLKKFTLLMKSRYNCGQRHGTPCPIKGVLRNGTTKPHLCQNPKPGYRKIRTMEIQYTTVSLERKLCLMGAAILKTFCGNEATKKTKKNQLKHQYGNFKAEGKETPDQTFNRLQAIEDINQIDEDDIKEMDIKWNMALLSMRADRFWKKIGKKITIHGTDVAGFDKSKGSKIEEQTPKALIAIDEVRWDWCYMANEEENHALVADEEALIEFTLMVKSGSKHEELEELKKEKEGLDSKLTGFQSASKDLDTLLGSQRSDKNKEGLGYNIVPPPAQVYSPLKKDMSWTGLPEFANDTITDYNRPSPSIENSPTKVKISKVEIVRKPSVKYAEMYRNTTKSPKEEQGKTWPKNNNTHKSMSPRNGKQHKASYKTKLVHSVTKSLYTLHMYLFGPTSDETSAILRNFITEIENLKELKVKIIRSDNRGEFRNKEMNDFCSRKWIKREFSNARTPQQNGVAKRKNRTLIEVARTMLADAKLPVTFWAKVVNTACYVQNRVLVNKSQNKTPYELFNGRTPAIRFLKPFGCYVMILNTSDNLGKFDAKRDEGYFIEYFMSSKAFRVFNKRTKRVEESLHVDFLENKLIKKGAGPNWLFDIDTLTNSMNYVQVIVAGTSSTNFSGTKDVASQDVKKDVSSLRYIALPNWFHEAHLESSTSTAQDACNADTPESSGNFNPTATSKHPLTDHMETLTVETRIPTVSSHVPTACLDDSPQPSSDTRLISKRVTSQDDTPSLDNILTLSNMFEDFLKVTTNTGDSHGVEATLGNMENNISASSTPTFRTHKDHPKSQIISPVDTPVQTRTKSKEMEEQSFIASIHHMTNPDLLQPIGTKWVLKNKKDERGIVIRNKAMLVAQRHTQKEGIDYEEVFAPVARIEVIRLFLAYASFMGFTVYQMYVKSAFLYGTIDEEVYVMQPPGFQDPEFLARVYKVEKAMYGLHHAPRAWYGTFSKYLLTNGFQRGTIDQTLFIKKHRGDFILIQVYVDDIIFGSSNSQLCREFKTLMDEKFQMSAMGELNFFLGLQVLQKKDDIFLSQDKYVGDILKKFGYSDVRSANTPMDKENPWGKDICGKDVDLYLYRSMIGSLMYPTASRQDIMFAVCASVRHQVTPKESHLHVVKRIFRYLKGHPKLGIWYPKDSHFDLVAYSYSDYGGATQDRKSTTRVCQILGRRLILWKCKKQTTVATSTTEAEYVAVASGCGQVMWIQNQLLDYRHHFIRDCFKKKLISVDHIHTDDNVADLLTKPFDAGRFKYLVDQFVMRGSV
nr:hypothetical protein [Tanacetum cinerariifolium]